MIVIVVPGDAKSHQFFSFLYSWLIFFVCLPVRIWYFLFARIRSLVFGFGNIINAAPVVAAIFYSILFAWLSAASKLSTLFVAQTEMAKAEKAKKE